MSPSNMSKFEISLFFFSKHTQILTPTICLYTWPQMLLTKLAKEEKMLARMLSSQWCVPSNPRLKRHAVQPNFEF